MRFFFDFADPLSYVISTQAVGWCKNTGSTIIWTPLVGSSSAEDSGNGRLFLTRFLTQTFGYPLFLRRELDSLPAMRASVLARELGSMSQFVMRVFQFWYATDLPPYSDILVDGLVSDCGLKTQDFKAALSDDHHWTSRALTTAREQALNLGVETVPTLVTPSGGMISFNQLNARNPVEELWERLADCGLSPALTAPSRCYLPSDTDQPERFCRWCTCGKGA